MSYSTITSAQTLKTRIDKALSALDLPSADNLNGANVIFGTKNKRAKVMKIIGIDICPKGEISFEVSATHYDGMLIKSIRPMGSGAGFLHRKSVNQNQGVRGFFEVYDA